MNSIYIGDEFVAESLRYVDLIPEIERSLAVFSSKVDGAISQPVRTVVSIEEKNGLFYLMPVYSARGDVFSLKVIANYPDNISRKLPTHQSNVWLYNGTTGQLKAIIDSARITQMRTAAASVIATKHLAPSTCRIHAIIGAGMHAQSHFEAMGSAFQFDEVRVWSRDHNKALKFAELNGCKATELVEEAVRNADVITLVTKAETPVLMKPWVKDGAHINGVGGHLPRRQEIDPELMISSVVYVDSVEAASTESGDIIKSKAPIFAEIGEVTLGTKEPRRDETTIFCSMGMAVEDLVAANMVYNEFMKTTP